MPIKNQKNLLIIAGPNGAGKSTFAISALKQFFDIENFVNADEIAKGLAPLKPESASLEASKIMIRKIDDLIEKGENFSVETTLSGKIYSKIIRKAKNKGYKISLLFFWLSGYKMAQKRVKRRVELGGHNIPADVIKRRYYSGLKNLINQYINIADHCSVIDGTVSSKDNIKIIAEKSSNEDIIIYNQEKWDLILRKSKIKTNE